jgi:hypothetical protein
METFITELRKAHLIFIHHRRGMQTVQELASITRLPLNEVMEWARLLDLRVTSDTWKKTKLPFHATPDFRSLNAEGN